jgi:hypothetical protein
MVVLPRMSLMWDQRHAWKQTKKERESFMKLTLTTDDGEVIGVYPIKFAPLAEQEEDGVVYFTNHGDVLQCIDEFSDVRQDIHAMCLQGLEKQKKLVHEMKKNGFELVIWEHDKVCMVDTITSKPVEVMNDGSVNYPKKRN